MAAYDWEYEVELGILEFCVAVGFGLVYGSGGQLDLNAI